MDALATCVQQACTEAQITSRKRQLEHQQQHQQQYQRTCKVPRTAGVLAACSCDFSVSYLALQASASVMPQALLGADSDCSRSVAHLAEPLRLGAAAVPGEQQQLLLQPDVRPVANVLQLMQDKALLRQPAGAELLEALLERALSETDAALGITLDAMAVASEMCVSGSAEAADRALEFAEQALAATVARLAKAQALVMRKVQGDHAAAPAAFGSDDEDLADTGSSAPWHGGSSSERP